MAAVNINRELAQWLVERVEEGAPERQVMRSLQDHGYDRTQVQALCDYAYRNTDALYDALAQFDADNGAAVKPFTPAAAMSLTDRNVLPVSHAGGEISVLVEMRRPHVVLLGNFLSEAECDELIELGKGELRRAEVVHRETGDAVVDYRRTSDYATFQRGVHPILATIEERIAQVTAIPVDHGEGLQIMRYGVGAEYQPHFDFFDPDGAFMRKRGDSGGQRTGTLIMYLNDPPAGGATIFPDAGLTIRPRRGQAVYFAYTDADGQCDNLSFHGGAPVVTGEKWIVTKWLRVSPYYSDV